MKARKGAFKKMNKFIEIGYTDKITLTSKKEAVILSIYDENSWLLLSRGSNNYHVGDGLYSISNGMVQISKLTVEGGKEG